MLYDFISKSNFLLMSAILLMNIGCQIDINDPITIDQEINAGNTAGSNAGNTAGDIAGNTAAVQGGTQNCVNACPPIACAENERFSEITKDENGCDTCPICIPNDQVIDCRTDLDCRPGLSCQDAICQPCICNAIYAPVCGIDGRTYGNECEAQCARIELSQDTSLCPSPNECPQCDVPQCPPNTILNYHEGEFNERGCPLCPSCDPVLSCTNDRECTNGLVCIDGLCQSVEQPCQCERIYMPVCGVNGNTYGNACMAGCEQMEIAYEGECRAIQCRTDMDCPMGQGCTNGLCGVNPCLCDRIYDPVCGVDGMTYSNACTAECSQVQIAHPGECFMGCSPVACNLFCEFGYIRDANGCELCECSPIQCRTNEDCLPILGSCGGECVNGLCSVTCMPNQCQTNEDCPAGSLCQRGQCIEADCPPVACDIVCPYGNLRDRNGCELCQCNPPPQCDCPADFAPVCGIDGLTYPNACIAACRSVEVASNGACLDCQAPPYNDPRLRYMGHSREECTLIRFFCFDTEIPFQNECGCGCEPAISCAPGYSFFEGQCVKTCIGNRECGLGMYCNVTDFCINSCLPGMICPDVCYGLCQPVRQ